MEEPKGGLGKEGESKVGEVEVMASETVNTPNSSSLSLLCSCCVLAGIGGVLLVETDAPKEGPGKEKPKVGGGGVMASERVNTPNSLLNGCCVSLLVEIDAFKGAGVGKEKSKV